MVPMGTQSSCFKFNFNREKKRQESSTNMELEVLRPPSPKAEDVLSICNEQPYDSDEEKGDRENEKILSKEDEGFFTFYDQNITIHMEHNKCGGHLWRSETVLLKYFENTFSKEHFAGKTVLELGAGTGLLGIAVSKLHGHSIITDLSSLLPLLKQNVQLNNASAEVAELCWGETDCTIFTQHHIDYIIASDCIYLEHLFQPLLQTIEQLSSVDTVTIVSFIKRRKADSKFWKLASKRFNITIVPSNQYSTAAHEQVQIRLMQKKPNNVSNNTSKTSNNTSNTTSKSNT